MRDLRPIPPSPSPWKLFLGTLCMVLVLITGTLSVTHNHANNVDEHGTCGLCVTAHMAAHLTATAPQIVIVQVFFELEPPAPVARPQTRPHFALFCRPPPALPFFA